MPTPGFVVLDDGSDAGQIIAKLGLPLVVKPSCEGSSIGMTKVTSATQLKKAWQTACEYDASVIAEQWITGKEYTVALLGHYALPLIRIETSRDFYDYAAKYTADDTRYHCPCGLDTAAETVLQQLALTAFEAIDGSGWGRVDIMCDNDGRPWLIEVNTIPGMTDHSLVPKAAHGAGIGFDELVWRILETSLESSAGVKTQRGQR